MLTIVQPNSNPVSFKEGDTLTIAEEREGKFYRYTGTAVGRPGTDEMFVGNTLVRYGHGTTPSLVHILQVYTGPRSASSQVFESIGVQDRAFRSGLPEVGARVALQHASHDLFSSDLALARGRMWGKVHRVDTYQGRVDIGAGWMPWDEYSLLINPTLPVDSQKSPLVLRHSYLWDGTAVAGALHTHPYIWAAVSSTGRYFTFDHEDLSF